MTNSHNKEKAPLVLKSLPLAAPEVFTFNSTGGDKEGYPILIKRHLSQDDTSVHEHAFHEIVFVESGTAEHLSAEGARRLVMGDILIIKPRIWHSYTQTKDFGIVNCLFDRKILVHQKVFLSLASGSFDLFQKPERLPTTASPTFLHATPLQRERIMRILNSMIYERKEKEIDWQGALVAGLLNLIITISRIHHRVEKADDTSLGEQTQGFANLVMLYLEEHFREKITLEELSKRFHASPSYLSRTFTKRMGMGIIDYVNYLRIETACELLRSTDWPASRVGSEVGYDEIPYFFRRFRREVGKSPGQYRNSAAQ